MESYQTRFGSFQKGKRVKKGSSFTVIKWPHPSSFLANPDSLAEAGFYFTPSIGHPDAVTCFMCKKELSDWEEQDDPFVEHAHRASSCCWAITRCGLRNDMDEDGNFVFPDTSRLPSSRHMEKARIDTYGDNWPHDAVKGHSANSRKMAKAGFIFTPQGPGDDTATCFYCGTTLSGWEEGDDPLEEHRKREAKAGEACAFLTATQPKPASRPSSRTQTKPPYKSNASKKKVLSRPENGDESPLTSDDELTPATTTRSRTSTTSKTRTSSVPSKTPASSLRKSTRSSTATKSASRGTIGSDVDDNTSEAGKRVSKTKRKGGKAKEADHIEAIREEAEDDNPEGFNDDIEQEQQPAPVPAPKKRGRPPKKPATAKPVRPASEEERVEAEEEEEHSEPVKRPAHGRMRSKAKADPDDEIDLLGASTSRSKSVARSKTRGSVAVDTSMPPPPVPSKPGSSSKSAGKRPQPAESAGEEGDEPEPEPLPKPKRTLVSKMKAKAKPRIEEESEDEFAASPEEEERDHVPAKKPRRAPSGKPGVSQAGTPALQLEADPPNAKHRKSSSTSEDAGYATAELLDPGAMQVESKPTDESLNEGTRKRTTSSQKSGLRDMAPPQHTHSSTDMLLRGSSVDSTRPPSRASSVRPFARSTSRPVASLAGRPPSRMGNEVVDISDSEDEPLVKGSSKPSKANGGAKEKGSSQSSRANGVMKEEQDEPMAVDEPEALRPKQIPQPFAQQKPPSKARPSKAPSKQPKFHVEMVVPPPSSNHSPTFGAQHEDIEMEDSRPTAEGKQSHPPHRAEGSNEATENVPARPLSPATPPPRTPSLPPADSEASVHKAPAPALPSFDEEMEAETAQHDVPPRADDDTLAPFIPFLSTIPLQRITSLTEEECDMTLEQYIRREIEREYERFKADGERRIAQFREKAEEARRAIESA